MTEDYPRYPDIHDLDLALLNPRMIVVRPESPPTSSQLTSHPRNKRGRGTLLALCTYNRINRNIPTGLACIITRSTQICCCLDQLMGSAFRYLYCVFVPGCGAIHEPLPLHCLPKHPRLSGIQPFPDHGAEALACSQCCRRGERIFFAVTGPRCQVASEQKALVSGYCIDSICCKLHVCYPHL